MALKSLHIHCLLYLFLLISCSSGISFNLEGTERFCLGEDAIEGDVLVGTFKYDRIGESRPAIILEVRDLFQKQIFDSKEESGTFSIDVKQNGIYDICFYNTARSVRSVTLDIKNVLKRNDDDNLMKKKHVEPLTMQMEHILESAKHLTYDLEHLKQREWEMRNLNETTNSRVLTLSVVSIVMFLIVAGFQVYYLKGFFSKKKLI
eukprot:521440_1